MNIYQQIASNKRKSIVISILFVVFITFFSWVIAQAEGAESYGIVGIALIISGVTAFSSYWWSDKVVLSMTRAKKADPKIHFDLYTTVENIAIAAGIPKPKVYVIDDEAPNAFATGRDPNHAVVVATTGLLSRLDRGELEGVIAHEISHIKNFDIRLMAIVTILAGTIVYMSDILLRRFWWRGRDNDNDSRSSIFLILALVLSIIAPVIAVIIKLAVSRKREYLADASGAYLTRNPGALADALEKIARDPHLLSNASNATAHLFISNPFKGTNTLSFFSNLFNTHPPIEDRIRRLRSM